MIYCEEYIQFFVQKNVTSSCVCTSPLEVISIVRLRGRQSTLRPKIFLNEFPGPEKSNSSHVTN